LWKEGRTLKKDGRQEVMEGRKLWKEESKYKEENGRKKVKEGRKLWKEGTPFQRLRFRRSWGSVNQ
jgi:hypothetical protein